MSLTYRRQIISLLAGYAVWGVFWGSWAALLPAGVSNTIFGLVLLGIAIGTLPAMLLFGPWIDRFGQWALVVSFFLFGLSIIALCFAHSPVALTITLLFIGATSGVVDVALNTGVASLERVSGQHCWVSVCNRIIKLRCACDDLANARKIYKI